MNENIVLFQDCCGSEKYAQTVRDAIAQTLREEKVDELCEVSVSFVDEKEIRALNLESRSIDAETDVLSFPMAEIGEVEIDPENGARLLGDIVISLPRALLQAEEYGHSDFREVGFLTVHSVLHLLGYDHVCDEAGEKYMNKRQESVLSALGLERG